MSKRIYIIAGPNGVGKTTASYDLLPNLWDCQEFVSAYEIARGLSPFNPEKVAVEVGRLKLKRIDALLKRNQTFAIETTLATKLYRQFILRAREQGYKVELLFFYLPTPENAIERVRLRVVSGGHNIPDDVIRRKYEAGLRNLFQVYQPIVDRWSIYTNLCNPPTLISGSDSVSEDEQLGKLQEVYGVENRNYRECLTQAINLSYRKMLERKAQLGERIHTDDGTGVIRTQLATDVYRRVCDKLSTIQPTTAFKKRLYLDIDGVLLTHKNRRAVENVEEFVRFVTAKYDCYWLTSHCKGDSDITISYLSQYMAKDVIEMLKSITPTNWSPLKTDAIDFSKDFFWVDDYAMHAERKILNSHNALSKLILVDLNKESLLDVINRLIQADNTEQQN